MSGKIKFIDPELPLPAGIKRRFVGCVVLTEDRKILLQQRGADWKRYPGYLAEFGGCIEANETPEMALVRELHEELGGVVDLKDVVSLGAVTEASSNFSDLIYVYFWHDKEASITGCYEGEPRYYQRVEEIMQHPKMLESVRWLILVCHQRGLI